MAINGRSAIMAGERGTYRGDPKVLTVGQTRTVVEAELGAPDMSSPLEGNKQKVIYVVIWDGKTPSPSGEHFSILSDYGIQARFT